MVCKKCENDLENNMGFRIFRDVAMVFVGAALIMTNAVIALSVLILVYAAIKILKKYNKTKGVQ